MTQSEFLAPSSVPVGVDPRAGIARGMTPHSAARTTTRCTAAPPRRCRPGSLRAGLRGARGIAQLMFTAGPAAARGSSRSANRSRPDTVFKTAADALADRPTASTYATAPPGRPETPGSCSRRRPATGLRRNHEPAVRSKEPADGAPADTDSSTPCASKPSLPGPSPGRAERPMRPMRPQGEFRFAPPVPPGRQRP
jgi:hypothetical protein